ncbi:MAG: thiaminase, partial [Mariniblastus sp.]
ASYAYNRHLLWYLSNGIGLFALVGCYWLAASIARQKSEAKHEAE